MKQIKTPASLSFSEAPEYRPKFFYGWWIVATCTIILTFTSGIGFYGLGIFLPYLEKEFRATPSQVSLGTTIFFLVAALVGPFAGKRVDLLGPRRVMLAGSLLFGAGLFGLGFSQELWQTYLAYMVLGAGFTSMGLITVSVLVSKWFNVRRGLALGLSMTGLSVGGVIIVPLSTQLIISFGWRTAVFMLAILVLAITLPLTAFLIRLPEDMGLLSYGSTQTPVKLEEKAGQVLSSGREWELSTARRSLVFWIICTSYFLANTAQTGVLVHLVRFLTYGLPGEGALTPQSAAFAISITALASIVGRLVLGSVVDRLNRSWTASAVMLLQAAGTTGLIFARGNLVIVYLTVLVFGVGMGSVIMLQALLVGDLFGRNSFGAIYGATLLVTGLGTALGPWLAGFLFDWSGSYQAAFGLFGLMYLVAGVIIINARRPLPSHDPSPPGNF